MVLTRKKLESIIIDGGIEITVVQLRNDRVRLGITAPAGVRIKRKEISDANGPADKTKPGRHRAA